MRIFILLIIFCFIIHAQKRFTSNYFVSKYNLSLPEVTKEMLDISDLTHTSDLWEYYYKGKTDKLDSAIEDLTIERFPYSRAFMVYTHKGDTAIERLISINLDSGDTLSNWIITYINNFRYKSALDLQSNCIWQSRFDAVMVNYSIFFQFVMTVEMRLNISIRSKINSSNSIFNLMISSLKQNQIPQH